MAISNNSTGLRPGVCTSTTRPTAPYEGQHIYETDTDLEYVWNGSAWVINYVQAASPAFTGTPTAPTAAVGTNTTQLATTAFVTTAAANVTSGFRNVLINGDMRIAQRGTSTASITTTGYYTADRWLAHFITMGTWTNSLETDAPTGSGFRNSFKMLCTTADASPAAGDQVAVRHRLEGQNVQQFLKGTASAKPFSLSFWVKSNVTGTYIVELRDLDNTRFVSASYTVAVSATWEKKTITFPADTTGAFDNNNGNSLEVSFGLGMGTNFTSGTLQTTWASVTNANRYVGQTNLAAATNNYWQVTGVQLEAGSQATPFEQRPIGLELELCQRYYQRMIDPVGAGVSQGGTGGSARVTVPLYTKMRAVPTSTMSGTFNFYNGLNTVTATYIAASHNSFSHGQFDFPATFSGPTQGQAIVLYTTGGSQYLDFSAEL